MDLTKIKKKKYNIEFVSANPTGPLTVGHGRGAMLGDTVSNILEWNGYDVQREYYFNNAGRQMRVLGQSVHARYLELLGQNAELPEGGYEGKYIYDIAQKVIDEHTDSLKENSDEPEVLHRGISYRKFNRRFTLANDVIVTGARLENGLLLVQLEQVIPEEMKPKLIDIK